MTGEVFIKPFTREEIEIAGGKHICPPIFLQ
jgi:hypothetical protein